MKYPGVQRLIDLLVKVDDSPESSMGFDMGYFYEDRQKSKHRCGSACCIAGWVDKALHDARQYGVGLPSSEVSRVMRFCNLPRSASVHTAVDMLLIPSYCPLPLLTLPMAIKVLEIFRDTGVVQWLEVYNEMKGDRSEVSGSSTAD